MNPILTLVAVIATVAFCGLAWELRQASVSLRRKLVVEREMLLKMLHRLQSK